MDNVVKPYIEEDSESSEYEDSSEEEILSSNIGIQYKKQDLKNVKLMDEGKAEDYEEIRNKYFTPELRKVNILIDSKNIVHEVNTHSTSDYTVYFDNADKNSTGGFEQYRNVIGFRLIKAIVPNTINQVTENNNKIKLHYNNDVDGTEITLDLGSYTFEDFGEHLIIKLNSHEDVDSDFTIESSTITYRYTLTNSAPFYFDWTIQNSAYRLVGALRESSINTTNLGPTHTFPHVVDQSIHFLDLVIPEIPYIACKHNMSGKNIIDRIPLDESSGELIHYTSFDEPRYFYPINLSKINIQLYGDSNDILYDGQNSDNSFEFEITMLNK